MAQDVFTLRFGFTLLAMRETVCWSSMYALLLCLLLELLVLQDTEGDCSFPSFLWEPAGPRGVRVWQTETKYYTNNNNWESQAQVHAQQAVLTFYIRFPTTCPDYEEDVMAPCFEERLLHRRYCKEALARGTFLVQQGDVGHERFSCLRFVFRSSSIVQVWSATSKEDITEGMCDDKYLNREEWPWLAPKQTDWAPCPLEGGFDFRTHLNERKKSMCHRVWRPSRLEAECVLGDGLNFLFPERSCSPFKDKSKGVNVIRLMCWGHWQESDYTFIVASDTLTNPQYVMRLPRYLNGVNSMTATFYFSPVITLREDAIPPGNILYAHMTLQRSEPGVCYDEAVDTCAEFARDGKCTSEDLPHYANHCKKSCGMCKLAPSLTPECHFPMEYQGEWLLFETDRREEVRINGGYINFSKLGTFICKGKHWNKEQYKLMSVYQNGCRTRYTCIHFDYREKPNILQFRLSGSNRTDNSFDMCHFQDDPPPVSSRVRSEAFKILLPVSRTHLDDCGLGGLVHVNAMFRDGRSCKATLSDWNPFNCTVTPKMALSFRTCHDGETVEHEEFICEAYVTMQSDYRLLITKQILNDDQKYSCWVIRMNTASNSKQPWRRAYVLRRAQCGAPEDVDMAINKPVEITFQIYATVPIEKDCITINRGATPHASTIKYTVRKGSKSAPVKQTTDPKPRQNSKYTTPPRPPVEVSPASTSGIMSAGMRSDAPSALLLFVILNIVLCLTRR